MSKTSSATPLPLAPSSRSTPASPSTSPTRTRPGSAARTRTPTACCDSTSPKAPSCLAGTPKKSRPSPRHSTADPVRLSAGRHPPKPNTYARLNKPVLRRPVESGQYCAIRYGNRLAEAGAIASIGSVGDSYDNALAESVIGLYKTECVRRDGPIRSVEDLELATASWVHWFNTHRLHSMIGNVPPVEYEDNYYAHQPDREAPISGEPSLH